MCPNLFIFKICIINLFISFFFFNNNSVKIFSLDDECTFNSFNATVTFTQFLFKVSKR